MIDISLLPGSAHVVYLSLLAHELTVCARSTYETGTENVSRPEVLRAYNELLHRVTGSLRDHIRGRGGIPISDIVAAMRDVGDQYNESKEMAWALERALVRTMSKMTTE